VRVRAALAMLSAVFILGVWDDAKALSGGIKASAECDLSAHSQVVLYGDATEKIVVGAPAHQHHSSRYHSGLCRPVQALRDECDSCRFTGGKLYCPHIISIVGENWQDRIGIGAVLEIQTGDMHPTRRSATVLQDEIDLSPLALDGQHKPWLADSEPGAMGREKLFGRELNTFPRQFGLFISGPIESPSEGSNHESSQRGDGPVVIFEVLPGRSQNDKRYIISGAIFCAGMGVLVAYLCLQRH
jgi:hypothetical protein